MRALEQTLHTLSDAELERAVEALCAAPVIHIYGVGASGFVALDAEHKFFASTGGVTLLIDNHVQRPWRPSLGRGTSPSDQQLRVYARYRQRGLPHRAKGRRNDDLHHQPS